ncbi:MAG: 2-oxoglutarate and iron-dependent oxygenase domain-containing protein [Gordonia sp. (in: high G+C Gram-positive bacteria)]
MQIPTIDLAQARTGGENRRRVSTLIDEGNRHVGFFILVNHGVSTTLLDELHSVTSEFFDLPGDVKDQYCRALPSSRGYTPVKKRGLANTLDRGKSADLVELFAMGMPHVPPDDHYFHAPEAAPNFQPNVWPAEIPEMQQIWTTYYHVVESLSVEVMELFAEALQLPTDYFSPKINKSISNLFANCYPSITETPEEGQLRVGEHTDYGTLTLLYQRDEVGGLEVWTDGAWLAIPATPNAFVVNIGDLMARWTNDRWSSTLHRVQNPPQGRWQERRISFPFFCQPNYDTLIEAIPTCVDADHPLRYAPMTSGENVRRKTESSFALRND